MSKTPTTKNPGGRPTRGETEKFALRMPPAIYAALKAKTETLGLRSVNEAAVAAIAKFAGVHYVAEVKPSTASMVTTAKPAPIKPGARLDKKASARSGPKIAKAAVPRRAPALADDGEAI